MWLYIIGLLFLVATNNWLVPWQKSHCMTAIVVVCVTSSNSFNSLKSQHIYITLPWLVEWVSSVVSVQYSPNKSSPCCLECSQLLVLSALSSPLWTVVQWLLLMHGILVLLQHCWLWPILSHCPIHQLILVVATDLYCKYVWISQ